MLHQIRKFETETEYLAKRRLHLYRTHGPKGDLIPAAQPDKVRIKFERVQAADAADESTREYFSLRNPNKFAVDISGFGLPGKEITLAEMLSESDLFRCSERREHDGDQPLDRPMTKFERRGLRKGHRIWDWRFDKL